MPDAVRRVLQRLAGGERSTLLGLHAIIRAADDRGIAKLHDAAIQYRDDTLVAMRADGRDVDREAGLLSIDQATANLLNTVLPRLVPEGLIVPGTRPGDDDGQPVVTVAPVFWQAVRPFRGNVADTLNSEYGESSGGGIRAGRQQPLFDGGNAFLDREYPRLDRLFKAGVLP